MKHTFFILFLLIGNISMSARTYFVAVNGNDLNSGTIESPFATLSHAQTLVEAGDTVYIRGGVYKITEDQIMATSSNELWAYVFNMSTKAAKNSPICYWGFEGERPIFDLSEVKPANKRVIAFYVTGHYLHFKNFEIIGTQVTIVGHTQSECFRNEGGNNNVYENLSMHDGMAIGFYLTKGVNNLVLNCDSYNNYDPISDEGKGGNVDGFGGHPNSVGSINNVFRGCRAWYNSDDGFDLISSHASYTIDNCWSFYNGYRPNSFTSAGDGSGFKAGGYGMGENPSVPAEIPVHVVKNCLAYYNKNRGFYANHHLNGIEWKNNTGYRNPSNFCMLNRKSAAEAVDVPGYSHIIENNLSYSPRTAGQHIIDVDPATCTISNNSFLPIEIAVASTDFVSLDETQLMAPRKADGSLPDINFMKLKTTSVLYAMGVGCSFEEFVVENYDWMECAAMVVENAIVKVVGPGAEAFTHLYIGDAEVSFEGGQSDISAYSGELKLKTVSDNGDMIKLVIRK